MCSDESGLYMFFADVVMCLWTSLVYRTGTGCLSGVLLFEVLFESNYWKDYL